MKIKVASRAEIITKATSGFEDKTMIISISCTNDKEPYALKRAMKDAQSNVVHVEFFHFDDIDKEYSSCDLNSISDDDAKRIAKTVQEWKDKGTWISGWSGDESDEGQGKSGDGKSDREGIAGTVKYKTSVKQQAGG